MAAVGVGVGGVLFGGGGRAARADNLTFLGANQDGGSGIWSASPTVLDWLTASDAANSYTNNGIAWNNAGGTTAVFGAGADGPFTVTVDANGVNAAGIVFNNSGYTIGGPGTINLTAGGTINSLLSNNNTIAATLAGTGVTYSGTAATATTPIGSVAVTGANTYTGPTNITGGILSLATIANAGAGGTAGTLGTSSNASSNLILNGGQLAYTGGTATTDRGFSIGTSESILNVSQGSTKLTFGGQVNSGTAIFDKLGAGTVTFANTGGNAFGNGSSGGLFILNGGLVLAGGTNTIGGTLRVGNNGNFGEFGNVLGPAFLTILGGTTTVSGSMLLAENGGAGNTDTVNLLNGATLVTTSIAHTGNANQTGTGDTVFNVGGGSTYNSGSNFFTLSVSAGTTTTVSLGDGSATPGTYVGQGLVGGAGTSTLNLNNATLLATASTATLVSGINTVNVLGGGVTFNTSTFADTVSSNLSGGTGNGGLTKLGTGTLTLTGADTYTGGTNVVAGGLDVENGGSLTSLTSGTNVLATGTTLTLGLGGPTGFTGGNVTSILADTTFAGNNTLGLNTAGGNASYSGNLAGSFRLLKAGANTLQLTGANSYTGGTNVSAGVLEIGNVGSIAALTNNGANTNLVATGAALAFDLGGTTGFNSSQIATVLADTNFSPGGLLGLIAANSNYNYAAPITGTLGVYTGGPYTLTLSGSNTYTGGTNVGSGTLMVGGTSALGAGNIAIAGGTLDVAGYNVSAAIVTISAGSVTDSVGGGSLRGTVYNVSGGTVSNLGGTGRFNKVGPTTYAPTGLNTYTGPTNVTAGILSLATIPNGGVASAIGTSSNASGNLIVGGGQLLYTGPTATTDRGITFANGTDTINVASGSVLTFAGLAANVSSSSFTKVGNGTVAFTNTTGTNALSTSAAYLNVGTVAVAANASFGSSVYLGNNALATAADAPTLTVSAGTTSDGSSSTTVGYYNGTPNVGLVSTLNVTGTGTYITGYLYTNNANYLNGSSATATTNSSVLNLSGSGKVNVSSGAYLDYQYAGGGTTVNMTGTSAFTAGTLYVGYTAGGTATFNQFGGSVTTGSMYVGYGNSSGPSVGVYNLGNGPGGSAVLTATAVIGGAGGGTFNFNGGTLQANASSTAFVTGLTSANVLAGGAVIGTNGFNDTIGQNLSSGTSGTPDGGLTKVGAGTLTLSGNNAYTGPTVINNGTLRYGSATALPAGTMVTANAGGTLAFGGLALEPVNTTVAGVTLAGLNAAAGSAMQFNLSGGSADAVAIAAAANVASGANITLALPSGVPLAVGNYTLFQDAFGGLSNFQLPQSNFSSGGVLYGLSLNATNTTDVLTVSVLQSFRYYYTGATSNSLAPAGNYALSSDGSQAVPAAPTSGIDLVFSASTLNTANATATLGGLSAVNALEFSSAAPITLTGPGTLTLAGGAVSFNAGTGIVVDAGAAAPTISANLLLPQTTTFVSNANASSAGATLISGVISGNGSSGLTLTSTAAAGAGGAFNLSGANTFAGPLNVSGGANLIVGTFNNGLAAGPLGMSSNASSNVLLQNGGTLTYTGGTTTTDRGITFGAGSGTAVNVLNVSSPAATLTFASPVASNAAGSAVVLGNGNVILAGTSATNTFGSNGLYVLSGALTLAPGTRTTDAGTFRIGNNGPSGQYPSVPANAAVTLNNASLNVSSGTFYMGYNDGPSHRDTLNVTNGSVLTLLSTTTLDLSGGTAGQQGVVVMNVSGGSVVNANGYVYVGGDVSNVTGANATLNLSDTAQLQFTYSGVTYYNTYLGYGGTGTLNLAGSGNVSTGYIYMGYGTSAAAGTLNLTGTSTVTNTYNLYAGFYGTGVINQSGGAILSGGTAYIGSTSSSTGGTGTGTLNQTGGTFNASGGVYVGFNGNGTVNQTAGTVASGSTVNIGYSSGYSGTYTLGGGAGSTATLVAPTVQGGVGTSTFNFNGGTLRANASSGTFMTRITTANVLAGGAVINTNGFNDTVAASLVDAGGGGGLTKLGAGTLTLTGTDTFTGPIAVNGGTLAAGSPGAFPSNAAVAVAGGTTLSFGSQFLQPSNASTPTFSLASLTLAGNGSGLTFGVGSGSADFVGINAAANIGAGSVINVVLAATNPVPGTYNLLYDANGGLGGFTLGQSTASSNGSSYALSLTQNANYEQLVIGGGVPSHLFFKGGSSNQLSDAANYTTDAGGTNAANTAPSIISDVIFVAAGGNAANYAATLGTTSVVNSLEFNSGNPVTIAGTGPLTIGAAAGNFNAGIGIVVDAGTVSPTISANLRLNQTTVFLNNTNASSAGPMVVSGVISGNSSSAGLVLLSNNLSTANIQTNLTPGGAFNLSGANTFTGPLNISNGASVVVNTIGMGGAPSSVGASTNAASNLILQAGGTLTYTGGTAVSDRGFTINGGVSVISSGDARSPDLFNISNPAATLTLGGQVVGGTMPGNLVKLGGGTLSLTNAGSVNNLNGTSVYVLNGLATFGPAATFTGLGDLRVGNDGPFGQYLPQNGNVTLTLNGATVNVGGQLLMAENNGNASSVSVNLLAGSTLSVVGAARTGGTGASQGSGPTTINVNGGATYAGGSSLVLSNGAGTTTTLNLGDGSATPGVMSVPGLVQGSGTSTVNFNNGTLRVNGSSGTNVLANSPGTTVNVLAGGATIDTQANSTTASAALLGSTASPGGGLTTLGTGTLTLTGASTYNGSTAVSSTGTLRVNGSLLSTGTVLVPAGGTLGGNGSVGAVTVAGTITAGPSATAVGNLSTGTQTWNASGTYAAKLITTTSDRLVMSGLTVAANSTSPFIINLTGTNASTGTGTYVLAVDQGSTGTDPFALGALTLKVNGGTAPSNYSLSEGSDTTGAGGYDLLLNTVAAPEPTSLLLAALAGAPLVLVRRRRRSPNDRAAVGRGQR